MGDLFYCCTSKYKELKVKYMLKFVVTHVAEGGAAAQTKMRVHLLCRRFKIKRKAPDNPGDLQTLTDLP